MPAGSSRRRTFGPEFNPAVVYCLFPMLCHLSQHVVDVVGRLHSASSCSAGDVLLQAVRCTALASFA